MARLWGLEPEKLRFVRHAQSGLWRAQWQMMGPVGASECRAFLRNSALLRAYRQQWQGFFDALSQSAVGWGVEVWVKVPGRKKAMWCFEAGEVGQQKQQEQRLPSPHALLRKSCGGKLQLSTAPQDLPCTVVEAPFATGRKLSSALRQQPPRTRGGGDASGLGAFFDYATPLTELFSHHGTILEGRTLLVRFFYPWQQRVFADLGSSLKKAGKRVDVVCIVPQEFLADQGTGVGQAHEKSDIVPQLLAYKRKLPASVVTGLFKALRVKYLGVPVKKPRAQAQVTEAVRKRMGAEQQQTRDDVTGCRASFPP